ncbi:hypothetical protein CRG98_017247 [Punica granatum]|uniref:Reverse transcriptase zinc-binding domain-containing protein n=1 Tax=Punica granatum TaxID=22663 RepID=A0A2I0K1K3_PUNGR|nr:hypothetical protein CRG98_017247 [Punica granatum]
MECNYESRLLMGEAWAIRDGTNVRFWVDRWVQGCGPLINDTARVVEPIVRGRMICEFVTDVGTWDYSLMEGYLSHTKLLYIALHRPPARDQGENSFYWTFEPTGNFFVKTAYCFLAQVGWAEEDRVWKSIWSCRGPQRVRTFLWLAAHARLLTNEHRARRQLTSSALCEGCSCGQETTLHALRDCSRAQAVWRRIVLQSCQHDFFIMPLQRWLKCNLSGSDDHWAATFGIAYWLLWNWRNNDLFEEGFMRPSDKCQAISRVVESWKVTGDSGRESAQLRKCWKCIGWQCPPGPN